MKLLADYRDLFIAWALGLALGALLVLNFGCCDIPDAPNYEMRPRQAEAMDIVWYGVFAKNIDPPLVDWVGGARLDCPGGDSFSVGDICAFGSFMPGEYMIHVAEPPSGKISDVPFSHELGHAAAWVETGESDHNHVGRYFTGDNLSGSGQIALARAGL